MSDIVKNEVVEGSKNNSENKSTTDSLNDAGQIGGNVGTPKTYVMAPKVESKERRQLRENFRFFGFITLCYALFYTFCLYQNSSGITMPFLQAATIFYYSLVVKKFGMQMKKDSLFYVISILLLGLSICLTDDQAIIALSNLLILMLFISFMIHQFYEDKSWNFSKFIEAIFGLGIYTIASVFDPVVDGIRAFQSKQKKENSKLVYVLIGICVAIPLLFVIMVLLLSADRIFNSLFSNIIDNILVMDNVFAIILMTVFAFVGLYSFVSALSKREINETVVDRRKLEPVIAITFISIISIIYILFCGIQIFGLFMGQLQLPKAYTYAQYAREGFFQLLFVCGINIIMVLSCLGFFRESKILKVLLTVVSVCTYIMVASSALRMILYISVYQLTFARIFVLWALLVISLVMAGIMVSIYKEKFPLFRYSMVVITVLYIGLAYSHPDYWIASYYMNSIQSGTYSENVLEAHKNRDSYGELGDIYYVTSLSSDASTVLVNYKKEDGLVTEYFNNVEDRSEKMGIRSFNLSRYIARQQAEKYLKK